MIEISITYSNTEDYNRLLILEIGPYYIHDYDMLTKSGKSKGWKLKNEWGAKKDPFILVSIEDKVLKCFYSESNSDIISELEEWFKEKSNLKTITL